MTDIESMSPPALRRALYKAQAELQRLEAHIEECKRDADAANHAARQAAESVRQSERYTETRSHDDDAPEDTGEISQAELDMVEPIIRDGVLIPRVRRGEEPIPYRATER